MKAGALYLEGACLVPLVWRADHPWTRLRGLLACPPLREDAAEGLLLVPCGSVHTMWMRYALDLVFLDAGSRVLGWRTDVRPWRLRTQRRAWQTLELGAGGLDRLRPSRGEEWTWRAT